MVVRRQESLPPLYYPKSLPREFNRINNRFNAYWGEIFTCNVFLAYYKSLIVLQRLLFIVFPVVVSIYRSYVLLCDSVHTVIYLAMRWSLSPVVGPSNEHHPIITGWPIEFWTRSVRFVLFVYFVECFGSIIISAAYSNLSSSRGIPQRKLKSFLCPHWGSFGNTQQWLVHLNYILRRYTRALLIQRGRLVISGYRYNRVRALWWLALITSAIYLA